MGFESSALFLRSHTLDARCTPITFADLRSMSEVLARRVLSRGFRSLWPGAYMMVVRNVEMVVVVAMVEMMSVLQDRQSMPERSQRHPAEARYEKPRCQRFRLCKTHNEACRRRYTDRGKRYHAREGKVGSSHTGTCT